MGSQASGYHSYEIEIQALRAQVVKKVTTSLTTMHMDRTTEVNSIEIVRKLETTTLVNLELQQQCTGDQNPDKLREVDMYVASIVTKYMNIHGGSHFSIRNSPSARNIPTLYSQVKGE